MEKKSQIYLSAVIMYLIVGLAGYINEFSNYWVVLIFSALVAGYAMTTVLTNKELFNNTKFDWISICSFLIVEVVLTVCIAIIKVPYTGLFKYFNYGVQILGYLFAAYAIVRLVLLYTKLHVLVKEKLTRKKVTKLEVAKVETNEVSEKVEEVIQEETTIETDDYSDVEVVGENKEPEVIGIELKKEPEVDTPYMEEEL